MELDGVETTGLWDEFTEIVGPGDFASARMLEVLPKCRAMFRVMCKAMLRLREIAPVHDMDLDAAMASVSGALGRHGHVLVEAYAVAESSKAACEAMSAEIRVLADHMCARIPDNDEWKYNRDMSLLLALSIRNEDDELKNATMLDSWSDDEFDRLLELVREVGELNAVPTLTGNEAAVLDVLHDASNELMTAARVRDGLDRHGHPNAGRSTVYDALRSLEAKGYADRPEGDRSGYRLTTAGRRALKVTSRKFLLTGPRSNTNPTHRVRPFVHGQHATANRPRPNRRPTPRR